MSLDEEFCTLSELADSMADAVVAKYARAPSEVFLWHFDNGETRRTNANETARTVAHQEAVLEIFRLIEVGEIVALTPSFMPAALPVLHSDFWRRIILREQAEQILQRLPRATQAPQPQAAAPAPVVNVSADVCEEWKDKARQRALEIIVRQKAKDLYPPQVDIADEIAREFRAAGVVGADGKPLTGAYIKRHALNGISSATGRQLSTSPRRGK